MVGFLLTEDCAGEAAAPTVETVHDAESATVEGDGGDAVIALPSRRYANGLRLHEAQHEVHLVDAVEEHAAVLALDLHRSGSNERAELAEGPHCFPELPRRLLKRENAVARQGCALGSRELHELDPFFQVSAERLVHVHRDSGLDERAGSGEMVLAVPVVHDDAIHLPNHLAWILNDVGDLALFRGRVRVLGSLAPDMRHLEAWHRLLNVEGLRDGDSVAVLRSDDSNPHSPPPCDC